MASRPLYTIDKVKNRVTDMQFVSFPLGKETKEYSMSFALSTLEMDECECSL